MKRSHKPVKSYRLFSSKNGILNLVHGSKVIFGCPSGNITLRRRDTGNRIIVATCDTSPWSATTDSEYKSESKSVPFFKSSESESAARSLFLNKDLAHEFDAYNSSSIEDMSEISNRTRYKWNEISCSGPGHAVIVNLYRNCGFRGRKFAVIFRMDNDRFVKAFSLCFNREASLPEYTSHEIVPKVRLSRLRPKPNINNTIKDLGFFNIPDEFKEIYSFHHQRAVINKLIRIEYSYKRYINKDSFRYLEPTYLSPIEDFFHRALQDAACRFINTVPQWISVKDGNWKKVEDDVREFSATYHVNLLIWTGVYKQLILPTHRDENIKVKISLLTRERPELPIPLLFWKVLFSPQLKKGIALITINNPFNATEDGLICKDIAVDTGWMNWESRFNIWDGYSYACSVDNFRETVRYFPKMGIYGNLAWEERNIKKLI